MPQLSFDNSNNTGKNNTMSGNKNNNNNKNSKGSDEREDGPAVICDGKLFAGEAGLKEWMNLQKEIEIFAGNRCVFKVKKSEMAKAVKEGDYNDKHFCSTELDTLHIWDKGYDQHYHLDKLGYSVRHYDGARFFPADHDGMFVIEVNNFPYSLAVLVWPIESQKEYDSVAKEGEVSKEFLVGKQIRVQFLS